MSGSIQKNVCGYDESGEPLAIIREEQDNTICSCPPSSSCFNKAASNEKLQEDSMTCNCEQPDERVIQVTASSVQKNVSSNVESREALAIINEEEDMLICTCSPKTSTVNIAGSNLASEEHQEELKDCICKQHDGEASKIKIGPLHVEEILKDTETELREEYDAILEREKENIKERFNFILSNEQTRASYMLREAHRERQEKIHALKTQLQCKNLAALMYVMCAERRRSRMEKLKIIEDYTNYINVLHDILTRGQELILHLSRGYKTAARVDHEWREKMKKVVSQFMAFIYHFAGGDPETNQYLIDLPKLLTTKAPTEINPEEYPCDCDDEEDVLLDDEPAAAPKEWWEDMAPENRPFLMYGDMADFDPVRRREALKNIKEAQRIRSKKTAPKVWKELCFKDMYLKSKCGQLDKIKNVYLDYLPTTIKWECTHSPPVGELRTNSKTSMSPYNRTASVDYRGTMGSILKIITSGPPTAPVPTKTELLGARDSMEITSTTKLRNSLKPETHTPEKVVLNIGRKRASVFVEDETDDECEREETPPLLKPASSHDDKEHYKSTSNLGSIHNDSLEMGHTRNRDPDYLINYERVCPMDKCQRMQVDSFIRTLPPYMRANPFTNFEQTFDQYETCTPEQLKMLQERIEKKMHRKSLETEDESDLQSPLSEWFSTGVGVQTSNLSIMPPCACKPDALASSASSNFIFNIADLEPVKLAMDAVHRECLFNDRVEFDRFKLIGQETDSQKLKQKQKEANFKQSRYQEISEVLEKHPSLLDIFQATAR